MREPHTSGESAGTRAKLSPRMRWIEASQDARTYDFAGSVRRGLTETPKRLDCRWFYDAAGSELFERICELPEYYLTRAEGEILRDRAAEIASACPSRTQLVELGSGSAAKTRYLIRELVARQGELVYAPIDISRSALEQSARAIVAEEPRVEVVAIAAEYEAGIDLVAQLPRGPKLVLWLGSNVGNFTREYAASFLARLRSRSSDGDRLLIGVDLRKDAATLECAYDDSEGVTALFNLNLLTRIDRELGGHFDRARFAHRASYDVDIGRVDMHLQSLAAQRVRIDALDLDVEFAAGELVHTESSYKYSLREIDALARDAGWRVERQWTDRAQRFASSMFAPI